jgi:4-hydroxy-tetrahydrodipicolinate synthase
LNPARAAFKAAKPRDTPQAITKYWQAMLGQVGGRVRRPLLELTENQKAVAREQFEKSGLKV